MQIDTATAASGVHLRSASIPGRCHGTLVFAVGPRDEPVVLTGITHLALHLIEGRVGSVPIPTSSSVTESAITFEASGTSDRVLAHLQRVVEAIRSFDSVGRVELDHQKRLLHVEEPVAYVHSGANLLTYRYGLGELGCYGFGLATVAAITRKDVVAWIRRSFVAANAGLVLTRPLPASFDLDLAVGDVPARSRPRPVATTPRVVRDAVRGVALSLLMQTTDAVLVGQTIRASLASRLVHETALAYSSAVAIARVDATTSLVNLTLDPLEPDIPATLRESVLALRHLSVYGPSPDDLALALEYVRVDLAADPASVCDDLVESVVDDLRGFESPSRDARLASLRGATPATIAAIVREALPSLIVQVDEDADIGSVAAQLALAVDSFDLMVDRPAKVWKKAAKGRAIWQATKKSGLAGYRATVTSKRLVYRSDADGVMAVEFDDLAVVGERPSGSLVLVDRWGRTRRVVASDWKDGADFVAALRKALPKRLLRAFPSAD
ncbi:MAG: hypothetical protein JWP75_910 [Frondihabitans sp.]|nr:hypothetical protein [Frondihabitans sp.]